MKLDLKKIVDVVDTASDLVQRVKDAPDTRQAILEVLPEIVALTESAAGRDLLNDPNFMRLVNAYITAKMAMKEARAALEAGILASRNKPDVAQPA